MHSCVHTIPTIVGVSVSVFSTHSHTPAACADCVPEYVCVCVCVWAQRRLRERFLAAQAIQRIIRGVLARKMFGKKAIEDHFSASVITLWLRTRVRYVVEPRTPPRTRNTVASSVGCSGAQARRQARELRARREGARTIQRGFRHWRYNHRLEAARLLQVRYTCVPVFPPLHFL